MYNAISHIGEAGSLSTPLVGDFANRSKVFSPRGATENSLLAPAVDIMNTAHFPEQTWSVNPCPKDLPDDRKDPDDIVSN